MLVALVLFAAPAATFSLTNFLGSRGSDFHASPGFVGLVGGIGVTLGGIAGSLIADALTGIVATALLGLMLLRLNRTESRALTA